MSKKIIESIDIDLISALIGVVTTLFTGLGGFLLNVIPINIYNPFAVGTAMFLSLIALLFILNISLNHLIVSFSSLIVFLISLYFYNGNYHKYTYLYDDLGEGKRRLHVHGTEYLPDAIRLYPGIAKNDKGAIIGAVDQTGYEFRYHIWTQSSEIQAGNTITLNYLFLAISLNSAIFCLLAKMRYANQTI
jgi:hypothetical protein